MTKPTSDKAPSLAGGISLLGTVGLICKVIGVLYRIPLVHAVTTMGVAVYQQVFPSYNLMLTISSAGIPVAVSRMVAHHLGRGEDGRAKQVFRVALRLLFLLGLVLSVLMLLFSPLLARGTGTQESRLGFVMIAPSLFFVSVMSAFRGYMQGRRRMMPTAISQLIEQVGKVAIAIPMALWGMRRGGYAMGAAGALLGTSIAEALALLYMMLDYHFSKGRLPRLGENPEDSAAAAVARKLTYIAIPITIGASIVPLAGAADSFMLVNLMSAYMPREAAMSAYGVYTGMVLTMINVPTALAMAMAVNLVPAIAGHRARQDRDAIRRESATGLRLASVVGFPASVGMSLLAGPILRLLFGGADSPGDLNLGARLLEISSLTILLFTQVQATSGILQGLHKQRIPMYTLALGMALKIGLNYTLVRYPHINIGGAPFASLLCYLVSLLPNLYYVSKYADMRLNLREILWSPAMATALMAVPVLLMKLVMGTQLDRSWPGLIAAMALAALVYFSAALKLGAVKAQDLPARIRKRIGNHA